MGFLSRRKKTAVPSRKVPGHEDLVAVPDRELEPIIDDLTDAVVEGMSTFPFADDTLKNLQIGLPYLTQRQYSDEAIVAGQTMARLGYLSRAAEFAKFNSAREADIDLLDTLQAKITERAAEGNSAQDTMAEFAAAMVASEPTDPSPEDGGPSWMLPGLGGTIRGRLRDHLLTGMDAPSEIGADDLKRTWKYGFFLRSLEEFFFEDVAQH